MIGYTMIENGFVSWDAHMEVTSLFNTKTRTKIGNCNIVVYSRCRNCINISDEMTSRNFHSDIDILNRFRAITR